MDVITQVTIFVLAAFVGFEVISKVPTTLHTPLMSQTNAIHGIVMLGGLIVVGYADDGLEYVIGTIAIAFGAINTRLLPSRSMRLPGASSFLPARKFIHFTLAEI